MLAQEMQLSRIMKNKQIRTKVKREIFVFCTIHCRKKSRVYSVMGSRGANELVCKGVQGDGIEGTIELVSKGVQGDGIEGTIEVVSNVVLTFNSKLTRRVQCKEHLRWRA